MWSSVQELSTRGRRYRVYQSLVVAEMRKLGATLQWTCAEDGRVKVNTCGVWATRCRHQLQDAIDAPSSAQEHNRSNTRLWANHCLGSARKSHKF